MAAPNAPRPAPGFAPREFRTVLAAAVGQATVVAAALLPLPALVPAIVDGGGTLLLAGVAVGAFGLGQAFLQLPLALLSDRWGRRQVLCLALGVLVLGSAIGALWPEPWGLLLSRALAGMAALTAAGLAWVDEVVPGQRGERGLAVVAVGGGVAAVLAVPVGALVGWSFGVGWSLLVVAVPAFVIALVTSVIRTEPPPGPGRRAALAPEVMVGLVLRRALRPALLGTVLLDAALVALLVGAAAAAGFGPADGPGWVRILVAVGMALAGVMGLGAAARRVDAGQWHLAGWISASLLGLSGALLLGASLAGGPASWALLAFAACAALAGGGASTSTLAAAVVVAAPESARTEATALRAAASGLGLVAGGTLGGLSLWLGGGIGAGAVGIGLALSAGVVGRGAAR
jgi:predicted MFS family arabinose efflux permease